MFVLPGYSKNCVRRVGVRRGTRTSLVTLSAGNPAPVQWDQCSEVSEVREQNPQLVHSASSPRTKHNLWKMSTCLFAVYQP